MADAVKGIVPPALSLYRTAQASKEREKRQREDTPRKNNQAVPAAARQEEKQEEPADKPDGEKTKGKILDINA